MISEQIKEADEINDVYQKPNLFNKKLPSSSSTGILSYSTHAQAVYTSRLLDFKNLPKPKNAEYEDYSGN